MKASLHLKIAALVSYVLLCTLAVLSMQQAESLADSPSAQEASGHGYGHRP